MNCVAAADLRAFEEEHHQEFLAFRLFGMRSDVSVLHTVPPLRLPLALPLVLSLSSSPSRSLSCSHNLDTYPIAAPARMAHRTARSEEGLRVRRRNRAQGPGGREHRASQLEGRCI